jgi:outer membrane protein OmpA-like peptidoglycan-associated protein
VLTGPDPVRLAPVSTSGLPVDVAVVSGGCTVLSRLTGDVDLVGAADTVCTLEATQAGDDTFAPAAPVRQVVTFASAADDRAVMTGPTVTAGSVSVDVAGNDPAGLRLVDVGPAAHGRVAVTGPSHLTYTPDAGFRGADSFRYTVEDPTGRRGSALVRIVVPDAPPSLDGARVSQVAGSTTRVRLHPTDPNSDHLRMTAHVARADADGTEVLVDGSDLVVSTARRVSGRVRVQVQVDDGAGARVTAVVVVRVSPRPVRSASRRLTRAGTDVSWRPATTTGARYEVRSDGRTICVTTDTHCATSAVLGPGRSVTVRVAGRDSTQSVPRPAPPVGHHRVLVATVYFDSEQWRLSGDQSRSLANVARRIRGMGFHVAHLAGYTDSDGGEAYNLGLSRHRTRRVSRFLAHHGGIRSRQAWFGYDDPVADNSTAAGKALNRRVEILVRY